MEQHICEQCGQEHTPCCEECPCRGDEPTTEELADLEMELELMSFENSLPVDVEMRDTHRIAFRAGWRAARAEH